MAVRYFDEGTIGLQQESRDVAANPRNRLMLAVLEEALMTFRRGLNSPKAEQRRLFYEVDRWVASHDTDWPFSFENICGCLGIEPDYIRRGLRRLKKEALESARAPRVRSLR
ncbi:MAG: hypothetical protein D6760_07485, partial [Deltaproteobacteria bacterium]